MTRCEFCDKPLDLEDEGNTEGGVQLCWSCSLHAGDDDCPACGSPLALDCTCLCDLNSPRVDWRHWRAA